MDRSLYLFVAGKSGGHIVPALTLAHQYKQQNPHAILGIITTNHALDKRIIEQSSTLFKHIVTLPLADSRLYRWYALPMMFWRLSSSLFYALSFLSRIRPDYIVSMGGLVSLPVCLAAWFLRIPVIVYELNATPGKAVALIARIAQRIYVCFSSTVSCFPLKITERVQTVSYPLRFAPICFQNNSSFFSVVTTPDYLTRVLVIFGGSQGSSWLNEFIKQYACYVREKNTHKGLYIIHQTGAHDCSALRDFYESKDIEATVFSYRDNLERYYRMATLVVARAGAGTLFELAFFKKRAVIIPLETTATHHQVDNAHAIAREYPELFTVYRQRHTKQVSQELFMLLDTQLVEAGTMSSANQRAYLPQDRHWCPIGVLGADSRY